jgi:hypothetical protein
MTTLQDVSQGLIVIHDLLNVFHPLLLIDLLLLGNIHLMLLSFHPPWLFLLLLQCSQISLVLLYFHLPLLLVLPLQFSQAQGFHLPLMLLLLLLFNQMSLVFPLSLFLLLLSQFSQMCSMLVFFFSISFLPPHKLLRCYKSTTVLIHKCMTMFKSSLPVKSPLHRCRRPSCYRHHLILSSTSTATILQSLGLSGLKVLL